LLYGRKQTELFKAEFSIIMSKSMRLTDQAFSALRLNPPCQAENIDKARALLVQAEQEASSCRDYIQLGLAYLELGQSEDASKAFSQAAQKDSKNPSVLLFAALASIDSDKFEQAQAFLDDLHKVSPDNQAAPTAQALLFLRQGMIDKVLEIIYPQKGNFDLTVSPPVLSRFAVAIEEYILPKELPEIEANWDKGLKYHTGDIAEAKSSDHDALVTDDKSDNSSEVSEQDSSKNKSQETKEHKTSLLAGFMPGEASSLASKGSYRLQRCWELAPEKRLEEIKKAKQELSEAYAKNPNIPQLAYDLGEACLGNIEFGHLPGQRINSEEVEALRQAAIYFQDALKENEENAYTLHYIARTALLLKEYKKAEEAWKLALKYFEKLPEANYGLAQLYTIKKDFAKAHQYMTLSLMSDLQLLRDRYSDLKQIWEKS